MLTGISTLIFVVVGIVGTLLALFNDELNQNKKIKYIITGTLALLTVYAAIGSLIALNTSSREQELLATITTLQTQVADKDASTIAVAEPTATIPATAVEPTSEATKEEATAAPTNPPTTAPTTPAPTDIPAPSATPEPPPPTPTSTPAPTVVPDTSDGTVLAKGETWRRGGVEMKLVDVQFQGGLALVYWVYTNNSDHQISLSMAGGYFRAKDSQETLLATSFYNGVGPYTYQADLKPGASLVNAGNPNEPLRIAFDPNNCNIKEITITIFDPKVKRMEGATWKIDVNTC